MIEFVLSATLLAGFFTGIFQYGYAFYAYNVLVNAVRSGARYASLKPYDSHSASPSEAFQLAVQNMVVYGDPDPPRNAVPVLGGLTRSNVQLTVTGGPTGGSLVAPASMTVSISRFQVNSIFSVLNLDGRPSLTFPYTGVLK
ncbi:MAG: TadE family protein [Bryobacteraceae bacterium]|jgi:hypothetical protein